APRMPKISPRGTSNETSSAATTLFRAALLCHGSLGPPPKFLDTPRTLRARVRLWGRVFATTTFTEEGPHRAKRRMDTTLRGTRVTADRRGGERGRARALNQWRPLPTRIVVRGTAAVRIRRVKAPAVLPVLNECIGPH